MLPRPRVEGDGLERVTQCMNRDGDRSDPTPWPAAERIDEIRVMHAHGTHGHMDTNTESSRGKQRTYATTTHNHKQQVMDHGEAQPAATACY